MKDLLLFPCSGNAREVVTVVEAINALKPTWNLLGFIDDDKALHGQVFSGYPVLGGKEILEKYARAKILAVPGRPENFWTRDKIIRSLGLSRSRFASLIHPSAQIAADTKIGYNTVVMGGVTATANVAIGNHCVILPNTVISHDSRLGSYTLVGSNVSFSGGVKIAPLCYIGTGSRLIQNTEVGKGALVGIGSVVLRSIDPYTVVAGNPARVLREIRR